MDNKAFELNKVAITMGKVLKALNDLEPKLKNSFDVYEEKDSLYALAYMCKVGIIDRAMNTTYLQNPNLPVVIPLGIIRVRRETMSSGFEITIGKLQELASLNEEVREVVDDILEGGPLFYEFERHLPPGVKESI